MDNGDIEVRTEAQRVCVQSLTLDEIYFSFRMQCGNSNWNTYCFASLACTCPNRSEEAHLELGGSSC